MILDTCLNHVNFKRYKKRPSLTLTITLASKWENSLRQRTVCDAYINTVSKVNSFPVNDQFSVLISTYNPERIEHLSLIIRHLLKSTKVHTVYITWHNPNLQVPPTLYEKIDEKDYSRVKVLAQTFDSLNNRFNPIDDLKTEAVYIMDDDIYIDIKDLEFTFSVSIHSATLNNNIILNKV